MKFRNWHRVAAVAAASTGAWIAVPQTSLAQDTAAGGDPVLEEVIVTAERREATLQKTAVAIAIVDPEEMSRQGVRDFNNLDKLVPDVQVGRTVGSTTISLRGVVSGATSPTTETPVAVHIDGAYIDRPSALDGLFFDVQRLEVLKGPQGTLYGRNTPAGAVNIITNNPTQEFGGKVELEGGSFSLFRAEAVLNLPVSERFALRFAGREYKHDGYYKSGLDDSDQQSGRVKALWTFSETDSLLLSADIQKVEQASLPGLNILGYTPNAIPTVPVPSDPFDDTAIFGPIAKNYTFQVDNWGLMAQWDHNFSASRLTVELSHRDLQTTTQTPGISAVGVGGSPPPLPVTVIPISTLFDVNVDTDATTLEARLASAGAGPLEWVAGVFYFDSGTVWDASNYQPGTTYPAGPSFFTLTGPEHSATSYAGFGQATWTPVEKWHFSAGARYTYDEKSAASTSRVGPGPVTRYPVTGTDSDTWSKFTGMGRIAYDFTPANMVYGMVSTGYQAGGFGYGSTPRFEPETITAYELGSKNRFLDDRLQLNLEAFYYDDRNRVANVFRVLNPGSANQLLDLSLVNAGKFIYRGGSADMQWALAADTRVRVNVAYTDGVYSEYRIPAPVITILDGTPQTGPKWTGRVVLSQTFHVGAGTLDLDLAGQYRGESLLISITPACVANAAQTACNASLPNGGYITSRVPQEIYGDSYWLTDLSLRYTSPSGKWSVSGYANNVFDGDHEVNKAIQSPSSNFLPQEGVYTGTHTLPATYGAILSVNF